MNPNPWSLSFLSWLSALSLLLFAAKASAQGAAPKPERDRVSDLLREADQALSPSKSHPESPQEGPRRKKAKTVPADSQDAISKKSTPSAQPPSETVMHPAEMEDVRQVIALQRSKAALPAAAVAPPTIGLEAASLQLGSGRYGLDKDDDHFETAEDATLRGVVLSSTSAFLSTPWSLPWGGKIVPIWRLEASYFQGDVDVQRTGIENERLRVSYNMVAAAAVLGLQRTQDPTLASGNLQWSVGCGPAVESLMQQGLGASDTTSGFFVTDELRAALGWRFNTLTAWPGLTLEGVVGGRGQLTARGAQGRAGSRTIALGVNVPISG